MTNSDKEILSANDFNRAHPLVKSTWHHFRTRKLLDPQGRLEPNARFPCLDVTVSMEQARRALMIFDAIIRACAERGWRVFKPERAHYTRNAETVVVVGNQEVHVAIMEKILRRNLTEDELAEEDKKDAYLRRKFFFTPTGLLRVGVGFRRFDLPSMVIEESESIGLDTQISEVITLVNREAERQCEEQNRDKEKALARQQQDNARLKKLREQEMEIARQKGLEQLANNWSMSERVRLFADSCEKNFSETIEASVLNQWLAWARAHADKTNPIRNGSVSEAINSHMHKEQPESAGVPPF